MGGGVGMQEGGDVRVVFLDVLDEDLEEASELMGSEGDDEFIAVVKEVHVVSVDDEAADIDEPHQEFGVSGEPVAGAEEEEVREDGDGSRGAENARTVEVKQGPCWS